MLRDGSIIDGRYRLLDKIGAGGMGSVWLAEKLATYERFAIKFIHQHALGDDSYCARFSREVQVLRGLRHPNIVDVFDWSLPEPGRQPSAYVVMELLEGEPLQDVLKRRNRIPPGLLVRIMLQVLDGIAAVHEQGIVHRDLSPANIFLVKTPNPVPRVKILDFGLAKGLGHTSADSAVTQPGSVLGRAAYAAPEIFSDAELDTRADIFACGMIMFRALVGRFPFRETKVDLMWAERYSERNKHDPYPPPSRFVGDIPAAVERIVVHALRRRPEERYPTATEMQKELLRADNLLPPGMRNITAEIVLGAASSAQGSPPGSPSPGRTTGRKGLGSTLLGTPPAGAAVPALATTVRDEAAIAARSAPRAAGAGHLATGPVVFGAQEEEAPAEQTVMARVTDTAVFTYSDPAMTDAGAAAESPASSGGSQTSAAGELAGDVASSIGAPALRRRSGLFRRPAVLAFAVVMAALLVTVGILVLRGGGAEGSPDRSPAAAGTRESPGEADAGEPEPPPRENPAERPLTPPSPAVQAKPSVRPETVGPTPAAADAGVEEPDAVAAAEAGQAEAGTVATADAGADGEGSGAEAASVAVAPADGRDGAGDPGTTVAAIRDAGPETAAARDAGTGTVAAARDAGGATPPRDAGAAPPPRDAGTGAAANRDAATATARDAGTAVTPRDTGAAATARDAGAAAVPRDTGPAAPPPDDFITDYDPHPEAPRDAGTSTPPPGGDDFLTDYEGGQTR
ncbi:MAG: protein kinase [Deltaproteobacteria bacterium]|nr:protein kinase [Deltaproteobacteria bacterium]